MPAKPSRPTARRAGRLTATAPLRRRGRFFAGGALVAVLVVAGAAALVYSSAGASLSVDGAALAKISLPLGGGKIASVSVVSGPHSRRIPVQVRGNQIWPQALIGAHQEVTIEAVVKRPGWISWLAGSSEHLRLTLITPSASLRAHYLTLRSGEPIILRFRAPIRVIAYGPSGQLARRVLASPKDEIRLHRTAEAGTLAVAAAPRSWESSSPAIVSWFPAGSAATAVASPAPGTQILPKTSITLTFSKPLSAALGSTRPPVSPATAGSWHTVNNHTIVFTPEGYGYGLGAKVSIGLPTGVRLVGEHAAGGGTWTVPAGSTLRLQQLLAGLGYLPLSFHYTGLRVAHTPQAQQAAAVHAPAGRFSWRYPNVPAGLRSSWSAGASGAITQGALMAFQNDHGLSTDGVAGATVWRALINAALTGKHSTFGYSYVTVSTGSQSLDLWHNGHTVLRTPVNTGISSAPTATGTYPVYEHIAQGTMSGTNPDGSHYNDPGIKWISYFNGGDALHAFTRAQYGFPQSLGCVEMSEAPAGKVWPFTPIGTLVHVV